MKKIISLLLVAVMVILWAPAVGAAADTGSIRLHDGAGLLSADDVSELAQKLDDYSRDLQFDMVIVTETDLGGKSAMDYADDYFDYNGFGIGANRDGALLLVSMEPGNRMCWISTRGYGIQAISDSDIEDMLDVIVDEHLAYEEYREAMDAFVELCGKQVRSQRESGVFTLKRLGIWLLIALVAGLAAGGIYILILRGKMKSVRKQAAANSYIGAGGLQITRSSDIFLYHHISRTRRETSNSGGSRSHTSSSGASHGGGGRRF